ncbi:MAG: hypothetical protein K2V38_23450, partial [Gemmataceae bacterium]|nr:hypothetical protein [Gemmataceae bacterium]
MRRPIALLIPLVMFALGPGARGQGTKADYERANTVGQWTAGKVTSAKVAANWTPDNKQFWYQNAKKEFVLVDVVKGTREVVAEDRLPKDAKPVPPVKKKGRDPEASDEEEPTPPAPLPEGKGEENRTVGDQNSFAEDGTVNSPFPSGRGAG